MFSRFTEIAIQSIMLAQEQANRFRHDYVGTEHILLGVLEHGDNLVTKVLMDMGHPVETIKPAVEDKLDYGDTVSEYDRMPFNQQSKQVLSHAWDEARSLGHSYVSVEHLFLAIFRDSGNTAARVLSELGITASAFKELLFKHFGDKVPTGDLKKNVGLATPTLDMFGRDLTLLAKENELDPVVGRTREIERIIQILSRRTKNNPVLTGEPGVGKTAIVEGLAQRINDGLVPPKLLNKRVISLDLGLLVAGTKYRGEFEDRVKKIMAEVKKSGNIIIFVDELHTIIGTGGSEGSLDASNLFKPALARREMQCIGATTLEEYRKHIEGDGALERRFQSVLVEEPSAEEVLLILRGIRRRYEEFHGVTITDDALKESIDLATRYINDRFLPDKAVDIIDESAAKVMLSISGLSETLVSTVNELKSVKDKLKRIKAKKDSDKPEDQTLIEDLEEKVKALNDELKDYPKSDVKILEAVVDVPTVEAVVSSWTGIPISKMDKEEIKRLVKMADSLKERIIGQDEAILAVSRAVKRGKMGLKDPKRPIGSFLFVGPSGVGKTEVAKALAEFIFGSEDALIRIDMTEFMEKHTVSRLIGSPPGYVGFNEGGQLTDAVRRKPYSVVLFDELEKASSDVLGILLQILEDGRLTDSTGRVVNFKNVIVIMTSNVGSKFIQSSSTYGFLGASDRVGADYDFLKRKLDDELKQEFRPEFLNRIDEIIVFRSLIRENIASIFDIMMSNIKKHLEDRCILLSYDESVKELVVSNGFDSKLGARPLRRSIQVHLEDKLTDALLERGVRDNVAVSATCVDGKVVFEVDKLSAKKIREIHLQKKGKSVPA